jgi:phenylpropionate dioxygenase-like ring-hydroxylating dioxygenase large terminal subunit
MSEKKSRTRDERTRNWNFIVYPESAPENWREIINETRIEWVEGPLHDRDINPDGEIKKSHYHVTLLFPSNKSYEQVKALTDSVKAPIPIKCQSVKGSIRYMVHKDNPEKYQYDWNDITCHGGADLSAICAPTATERMQIQIEIMDYIRTADITEFEDIAYYARDNGLYEWVNVLMNYSTLSITALLRSRRFKRMHGQ